MLKLLTLSITFSFVAVYFCFAFVHLDWEWVLKGAEYNTTRIFYLLISGSLSCAMASVAK